MKENDDQDQEGLAIWDCGSPLYDSYELVAVGHILDRHVMILPAALQAAGSRTGQLGPGNGRVTSGSSSMAGSLSHLVGWKRRIVFGDQRKEKAKKLKTGLYGFYSKVGFWKKFT